MRWIATILGILLVGVGAVWFLQGINLLPGSFMTGQVRWAIIGAVTAVVGVVLLVAGNRLRRTCDMPPRIWATRAVRGSRIVTGPAASRA